MPESTSWNFNKKRFLSLPSLKTINMRGFTLVELLVVLAIISILTFITLGSFNNFQSRQEVRNAATEIKAELRKYQNYAISGQKNPDPTLAGSNNCESTGTLDHYQLIFVEFNAPFYRAELYCPSWPNWTRLKEIRPAWTDEVEIERVGYERGALDINCRIIWFNFRPLNEDVELMCWAVDVTALADRMYIQVRGSDPNMRYRINVTPSGLIYEERL